MRVMIIPHDRATGVAWGFSSLVFDMNYEHDGYRDFVWNIELHKFGLELIGLWPKMNKVTKNNFTSDLRVGIIVIIMIFLTIIPLANYLIRVWGDMILMMDNLQVTLPFLTAPLKLIIMRWKQTVLSSVVKMMAEDWMNVKTDAERDVMIRRARIARLIVIVSYVTMILSFIIMIIFPLFGIPFRHATNLTDRDRLLPLPAYYFYDTDNSPQYELTLVVQALAMFLTSVIFVSVDGFLGLIVLHICGQLENFRHRLLNLILCKHFENALLNSVEAHLRLIRFIHNVEEMFSLMLLIILLLFAISFCLYGSLFITVFIDNRISDMSLSRLFFLTLGSISLLVHTFLYCGAGEIIAEHSEAVYRSICDLEWYKLEFRNGKNLILLMIRANEPFCITAGKMMPLAMTTFCSILKTTAGYISFLMAKQR